MIHRRGIAVCGGKARGRAFLLPPTETHPTDPTCGTLSHPDGIPPTSPHTKAHPTVPKDSTTTKTSTAPKDSTTTKTSTDPKDSTALDSPNQQAHEIQRFTEACARVSSALQQTQARLSAALGVQEAAIFDAQAAFLEDDTLLSAFYDAITQGHRAETAFQLSIQHCESLFLSMASPLMRERVIDLRDVGWRVLSALRQELSPPHLPSHNNVILVGHEIYPSILADITEGCVKGILAEEGGFTSHVAVLAHAMKIPYITGLQGLYHLIQPDMLVALDGDTGDLWIEPDTEKPHPPDITEKPHPPDITEKPHPSDPNEKPHPSDPNETSHALTNAVSAHSLLHAVTACGERITLRANLSLLSEIADDKQFAAQGIEGVGLFRTEFLFLRATSWPDEETQFALYRQIVEAIAPNTVTFRCVDIGADKPLGCFPLPPESNPQIGWRGIRILLDHRDLLIGQLQALLRASHYGPLRIMVPMISTYEEIQAVRQCFQEAQDNLRKRSVSFDPTVALGMMVETPAAALALPHLAPCVDFLSVGSNDLLQFVMAADRNNTRLHPLFQPLHPGFLRLLSWITDAARSADRPFSLCGEIAGQTSFLPIALGLGFRELSMAPRHIPTIQQRLQHIHIQDAQSIAHTALTLPSHEQICELLIKDGFSV